MTITLDTPKPLLKPKGSYWRDLQKFQKDELLRQLPALKTDPNYIHYKYYYSVVFKHWIICNAFTVPIRNLSDLNQVQQ